MGLDPGARLTDRYEILSLLGSGGMGEVYRARDLRLGRDVAIKVLPERLARDSGALARFEREARSVAALSHPNILAIYDFGSDGAISFAVMELLNGETLRKRLKDSVLSWRKATEIAVSIAEGLSAAHSKGVTHRDLKPENIFLTSDGQVKVLDFGLAQWKQKTLEQEVSNTPTESQVTQTGSVMGTVPYMSPEQVRGMPVDARSDIFSFGSVLYEMLTGSRAFGGNTAADTIAAILKEDPKELDELKKTVPVELERVIAHCLEKNPEQRFQTARDLAFDLKSTLSGSTSGVPPSAVTKSRFRSVLWSAAVLILLCTIAAVYFLTASGKAIHSLAIVPFTNITKDPQTEYLSDGISESIISSLSQLPRVHVMAHDTAFSYKGQRVDPRKVGRDLNVEAVVTGSVLQQGDTLVIRADLINVADGRELWGQQYERKLTDLLAIQAEISSQISDNLQFKLTGEERKRVSKQYPKNTEAYQLYLQGRYYWSKETPEGYGKSIQYYQQALQKDPQYALAYAGLASSYSDMAYEGVLPPEEGFKKSHAAATQALKIDESLAEAYVALGGMLLGNDWNREAADHAWKRAIELNPNETSARRYLSKSLMYYGRTEEAIAEMKRVLQIDPLSMEENKSLGATLFWAKQYDQAIEQLRKTADLDPNYAPAHDLLADVLERKGNDREAFEEREKYLNLIGDSEGAAQFEEDYKTYGYQEARRRYLQETLEILKETSKEKYVSPVSFAQTYALLNDKDQAFLWLEKAYQERSPWLVAFVPTDPQFDSLRSDPRFKNLMQRIDSRSRAVKGST